MSESVDSISVDRARSGLDALNTMTAEQAEERLATCCAARAWVARMLAGRPYADVEELLTAGDRAIRELGPDDLADALAAHPRIGQRVAGSPTGPPGPARSRPGWPTRTPRSGRRCVRATSPTGSASTRSSWSARPAGHPRRCSPNSAADWATTPRPNGARSPSSCDRSPGCGWRGRCSRELPVDARARRRLRTARRGGGGACWSVARGTGGQPLDDGVTDADSRLRDLAPDGSDTGDHCPVFATGDYFTATGRTGSYPEVAVTFTVAEDRHHHVPLLLSPYAFSTYRGS